MVRAIKLLGMDLKTGSGIGMLVLMLMVISCPVHAVSTSTADHTKFKQLKKNFKTGPEVTRACISCHTEAARQIHKTNHWTWEFLNPDNKQRLGKRNILNNFCITPQSNFAYCTACHIGYGWKDEIGKASCRERV